MREANFSIDIHNPDGIGQAQSASAAHPLGKAPMVKLCDILYGCLVPRSVDGQLVAGRCISGSHEALTCNRVQVITMVTGLVASIAAVKAARLNLELRTVYISNIHSASCIRRLVIIFNSTYKLLILPFSDGCGCQYKP